MTRVNGAGTLGRRSCSLEKRWRSRSLGG
uniref:Uncharacterized protein n=1 Tax=Arundo donax TaxID=35708 RepID=A0A0A9FSW3_ARUDO